MTQYEVIVSNVGTVYDGNNSEHASKTYHDYIDMSKEKYGRCSNEEVTLFMDGDIIEEYVPEIPEIDYKNMDMCFYDFCDVQFLTDHHNREGELLIPVYINNETTETELRGSIIEEINNICDLGEKWYNTIEKEVYESFRLMWKNTQSMNTKVIDRLLKTYYMNDEQLEDIPMWFLFTWDEVVNDSSTMAKNMVGDGNTPNMYFVSISNDYYFWNNDLYGFDWASDHIKDYKANGSTIEHFNTFNEALEYIENNLYLGMTHSDMVVNHISIEDRISGEIWYMSKYFDPIMAREWDETIQDTKFTEEKLKELDIEFE